MPVKDTRNREEAKKSNVVRPYNPLMPYDKALFHRFKDLYDETYFIDTYESAMSINAKAHKGKVILPMISIYRMGDYTVATDVINDWAVRAGYRNTVQGKAEFENYRIAMHTLPVTLTYQIDVWATRRDVVDGITAELLMEFRERPHFKTRIQDMGLKEIPIEFDFQLEDSVVDNTSITEFDDTGRYYRFTLTGNVPSAAIFRIDIFDRIDKEEFYIKGIEGEYPAEPTPPKYITNKLVSTSVFDISGINKIDKYGLFHEDL